MSDLSVNIIGYAYLRPEGIFSQGVTSEFPVGETVFDVRPLLRDKKTYKFMAKQDSMAVYASIKAIEKAGLTRSDLGENTGLYFAVGTIPFEQQHLDVLSDKSVDNESGRRFSMQRFSTAALNSLNPLLTFKCLPNMPVFHVSYNLGITGPYYVTYPGAGQWLQTLQKAIWDLSRNKIEYAIVGAVADQRNPLVRHHVQRSQPESVNCLIDSACVFVLSNNTELKSCGQLAPFKINYTPHNILSRRPDVNKVNRAIDLVDAGVVDPALWLAHQLDMSSADTDTNNFDVMITTLDGISAELRVSSA